MRRHHVKKGGRKEPKTKNVQIDLLARLFKFLARRTESKFNLAVFRRLCTSRVNRPPVSLSRIIEMLGDKRNTHTAVVVGTVTNDERMLRLSKITVAALKFTKTARERIEKNGGEALTLDQLAQKAPLGENTLLIRGQKSARKSYKHFGIPGARRSTVKARVASKGRKFERPRNRSKKSKQAA